jgi:hypothetical protein
VSAIGYLAHWLIIYYHLRVSLILWRVYSWSIFSYFTHMLKALAWPRSFTKKGGFGPYDNLRPATFYWSSCTKCLSHTSIISMLCLSRHKSSLIVCSSSSLGWPIMDHGVPCHVSIYSAFQSFDSERIWWRFSVIQICFRKL